MKSPLKLFISCTLLSTLIMGCSANNGIEQLFVDGQERIQLRHQVVETDGQEQIAPQGYTHPVELSVDLLEALLNQVDVSKFSLFSWSDPQALFYEEEIKKLAPRLSDAFKKANSDQWIYFSITAEKPGLFSDTLRLTDGICFLEKEKLNFVFNNINLEITGQNSIGTPKSINLFKKGDPREQYPSQTYRFVFQPDKGYSKPPVIVGDQWLAKEQTQWLVFNIKSLNKVYHTEEPSLSPVTSPKTGIKERLKKLKELHEQELITDQEYEEKRKAILKEL